MAGMRKQEWPVVAEKAEAARGHESLQCLIRARIRGEVGFTFLFVLTSSHSILILRNNLA